MRTLLLALFLMGFTSVTMAAKHHHHRHVSHVHHVHHHHYAKHHHHYKNHHRRHRQQMILMSPQGMILAGNYHGNRHNFIYMIGF